ncbi:hypothetical protein ABK040_001910 [Willaertia magna]
MQKAIMSTTFDFAHLPFQHLYHKIPVSSSNNITNININNNANTSNNNTKINNVSSVDFFYVHKKFCTRDEINNSLHLNTNNMINQNNKNSKIEAIVFDMDGTLTIPSIDFQRMRNETKIFAPKDILDEIHSIKDENEKERLFQIIDQVEEDANERLQFQPNLFELFDELLKLKEKLNQSINFDNSLNNYNENLINNCNEKNDVTVDKNEVIKHFAVVTRNSEKSLNYFINKLGKKYENLFSITLSRNFIPYKPNPGCLTHITKTLNLNSNNNILMVGDTIHDIKCGKQADSYTCLYTQENDWTKGHSDCVMESEPDFICHNLIHIIDILNYLNVHPYHLD